MNQRSPRTTALITAVTVAVLSVLGTTAYAAGQLTGKDIKDKSLGPNDVLARVANGKVDDAAASGVNGIVDLVTVTVKAPTKGYLAVTASSDVFNSNEPDPAVCWIELGGVLARGSSRTIQLDPLAGNGEENCGTDVTIPVAAGIHKVSFVGAMGLVSTTFDETTLSAEFIPFNGAGHRPTSAEIAAALDPSAKTATFFHR